MPTNTTKTYTNKGNGVLDETINKVKTKKQFLTGRTVMKETNAFVRTDVPNQKTSTNGTRVKTVMDSQGNVIKRKTKKLSPFKIFGL